MARLIATCLLAAVSLIVVWTLLSATPKCQIDPFTNRVILIRHAEKGPQFTDDIAHTLHPEPFEPPRGPPPPGRGGRKKFPSGLNDDGRKRAQYLRTASLIPLTELFGNESEYDIGMILAAPRDMPIETERTYATVAPLAENLGLEVMIECAESGASCVARQVEAFSKVSNLDILIAWKHRDLNDIATALGARNARQTYPDDRYDIIWMVENGAITEKRSMHCPGLDDRRVDEGDPDLEIERKRTNGVLTIMQAIVQRVIRAW